MKLNILTLKKEARLFDAKEYLLKTFIAVVIGFLVGNTIEYVSKDMVSMYFGLMMTLEPVNATGIKSGLKQIQASIIGAVVTGIIVMILGYNVWTIAFGLTATLYVSLLMNWKEVPVVALFTSIYMTQLVQLNTMGQPSEWLTFKLRIVALGTGVLIAIIINFLFSLIGYKKMIYKRLYYIMDVLVSKMKIVYDGLDRSDNEVMKQTMYQLPDVFNNVDWIRFTVMDISKDKRFLKNIYSDVDGDIFMKEIELLRDVTHILYDMCYQRLLSEEPKAEYHKEYYSRVIANAKIVRDIMETKISNRYIFIGEYDVFEIDGNKNTEQLNDTLSKLYKIIY